MSIQSQIEREENQLQRDYDAGLISREQLNKGMRELQREYRDAAHEAAQDAHDQELQRW